MKVVALCILSTSDSTNGCGSKPGTPNAGGLTSLIEEFVNFQRSSRVIYRVLTHNQITVRLTVQSRAAEEKE